MRGKPGRLDQFFDRRPVVVFADMILPAGDLAEHHLAAAVPEVEAELHVDAHAMKGDRATDGDAAAVRADIVAVVGQAESIGQRAERLASVAMKQPLRALVIGDALVGERDQRRLAPEVGDGVHARTPKLGIGLFDLRGDSAEMTRKQDDGGIAVLRSPGVAAVVERGIERVEGIGQRSKRRWVKRLLVPKGQVIGHGDFS